MTTQFFVQIRKSINASALLALTGLLLQAPVSLASDRLSTDTNSPSANSLNGLQVGRVNLVLGKSFVESPGRERERLVVGSAIQVGDLISTTNNGHVHIQFEDDAYVSVRPNSRLEVVRYQFNREQPELSSVKFNLQEGVTRSISGTAAKSARGQFRMNTPIAAIGVRGTDFVVSATETTVRALVNEGVIVMAPYSAECSAEAFGPCGKDAVELAGASMQILEQDGIASLPRLIPTPLDLDSSAQTLEIDLASVGESEAPESATSKQEIYRETATLTKAAIQAGTVGSVQQPPRVEEPPVTPTPPTPIPTPIPTPTPTPTPPAVIDFTPEAPVTVASVADRQLVWGRYSGSNNALDQMTLSFAEASAQRSVTVGNFDVALYRSEMPGQDVERGLGVISFALDSAQAQYDSASGVVAMQVAGGSLDIDFQENSFATLLNLSHDLTGAVDFAASGRLFSGGYFHNRTDSQRIAGAVSLDGKEAGYFFEQQLQSGSIKGLTLWNSK